MVKHGIAEPSCGGEWCANVVLTPKKDGTKRFAIDFRGLNKKTRRTVYTLPRIDMIFDSLKAIGYSSALDIKSAYWTIPVEEESKKYLRCVTKMADV